MAGKLAALKQVPINPRLEPAATDRKGVELSAVTLDSLNSQVHGYLATPKGGGKHPALVIFGASLAGAIHLGAWGVRRAP